MFKNIPGSSWSWSMNIQTMNKLKYKSIFISLTSLFAIWFPCFLLCRFIVLVTVILFWNVENSQSRMNRCVQTCDYIHTWLKRRSTRFLSLNRLTKDKMAYFGSASFSATEHMRWMVLPSGWLGLPCSVACAVVAQWFTRHRASVINLFCR